MKTIENHWQHALAILALLVLWAKRSEKLAELLFALYAIGKRLLTVFQRRKPMKLLSYGIGNLGSAVAAQVEISVVRGVLAVGIASDLPAVIVAAAQKTENKVDDVPAAFIAAALKGVTKDFSNLPIGTIHGVAIVNFKAGLDKGALSVSFETDIPQVDVELAKETKTKIDDVVAEVLNMALTSFT